MRGEELLRQVSLDELRGIMKAETLDDFLLYGHGVEVAMTDAGKTNDLRYFAKESQALVVAWNPEDEPMPGVRCDSPRAFYDALKAKARKINYVPPEDEGLALVHFTAIRAMLRSIGNAMRKKRGGREVEPWTLVLLDEVQKLAGKADRSGVVVKALKEDRKRGIRYWSFTQEPSEVPQAVFTQSQVFMLKEVKAFRVPYLEDYGLPMSLVWDHIQKPYHSAVVVKNVFALCDPLPLA